MGQLDPLFFVFYITLLRQGFVVGLNGIIVFSVDNKIAAVLGTE